MMLPGFLHELIIDHLLHHLINHHQPPFSTLGEPSRSTSWTFMPARKKRWISKARCVLQNRFQTPVQCGHMMSCERTFPPKKTKRIYKKSPLLLVKSEAWLPQMFSKLWPTKVLSGNLGLTKDSFRNGALFLPYLAADATTAAACWCELYTRC